MEEKCLNEPVWKSGTVMRCNRYVESDHMRSQRIGQPESRASHQADVPVLMQNSMLNILLIDDNEDILALGKLHLERSGILAVDTIISAVSAIKDRDLTKYDAILSDYHMPVMDGIEFLQYIRKNIGDIPVLLITSDDSEDLSVRAFDAGADACMRKSTTVKDMFHTLESLLVRDLGLRRPRDQLRNRQVWAAGNKRLFITAPDAMILVRPLPGGCLYRDIDCNPFLYVRNSPQKKDRSILPRLLNGHARNLMRTQTIRREFRERNIIQGGGGPSDHGRT